MDAPDPRANGTAQSQTTIGGRGPDPLSEASGRLRLEADQMWSALKRAWFVDQQLLKLTVFDVAVRVVVFLVLSITAAALIFSAAILAVSSVRRGFALWADGAWWSDLALAALIGALVAAAIFFLHATVHRSVLTNTRARLAPESAPTSRSTPTP